MKPVSAYETQQIIPCITFFQEVDGHALLLLTVQEIHHILGVRLGPAMKIHDFIYSLQQLVNDAYISNKNKTTLSKYGN